MQIIKELKERWISESPIFFIKLQNLSIRLGISAVSILGAEKLFDLEAYGVPSLIFTVCGYIIVFCAALGLSAKLTKK